MYVVIGLCGLLVLVSYAQAADPAAMAVQKRYDAVKTMKAEFVQVLTHQESGSTEERTGLFYFVKPGKIRWETVSPIPELLLVTPEAVWNVFPDEDMAYKYPAELSEESAGIVRIVTGQSNLEKDFMVENKGTKNGVTSLVLYPKNPTQSLTEAALEVDAKTGVIKQVTVIDFFNNRNAITFTSQTMDASLDNALFTFTPPAGMKVEDRSKDGVSVKPLMQ